MRLHLIGPWRLRLQWLLFLLWLGIPLLRPHGIGMLRIDLAGPALEIGGLLLPIEDFYLLLPLSLALLLLLLFLTLALGRVWCGWLCPQTALVDSYEALARRLGLTAIAGRISGTRTRKVLLQLAALLFSLFLGYSLLAYFVPPQLLWQRLFTRGDWPLTLTLAGCAVLVYLDLTLLRRLFCREFCPYGRLQATLIDPGTLVLRYHPHEAPRCIRCGACVRACPVGIDIRNGEQIECINCGRCLDACRKVMHKRFEPGIIRYTFGLSGRGVRALLNPRMLLVGTVLCIACGAFFYAVGTRPVASLKLARTAAPARRLADGRLVVFYQGYLHNRSRAPLHARLTGHLRQDGTPLTLLGPVAALTLQAGEHRKIDFALVFPAAGPGDTPFDLDLAGNTQAALATAGGLLPAGVKESAPPAAEN